MTLPGIEPAAFRFVAQHLNRCAIAVPIGYVTSRKAPFPRFVILANDGGGVPPYTVGCELATAAIYLLLQHINLK